ncbi:SulP family inorganic anion transporter [Gordonia sp. DT30]|uniref:SulP family inorganic anion transporter n=1 Tax=unclassified Gordonia (in: high G+C Gram-positive bacteria) TaxID=2657482 RepID=UPI003CED1DBA
MSGFVTALFSIPEGMAYAAIGGFNPVNGLYSGMVSTLVGSVFARTVLMVTTLTSAIALSSQSVLAGAGLDPHDAGNIAMLTITVGVIMAVLGLLRVGAAMNFVSGAVMTGFTVGIAVQIVSGVLKDVTGYSPHAHNTLVKFVDVFAHIGSWSWSAVGVAAATVAAWAVFRVIKPVASLATLLALAAVTTVVAATGIDVETVGDISRIQRQLPPVTLPDVSRLPDLAVGAFAIALVALAQAAGISGSVPNPGGSRPNASGDFTAQGIANVAGGFFGSLPTGGSLSRTGVAVSAGAQTRWAGIFAGIWLVVLILIAGSAAQIIPMPVIGGLLVVIGAELITGRVADIILISSTAPLSAVAMVLTFAATTALPLQDAILGGAAISLVLYCVQAARASRLVALDRTDDGHWHVVDVPTTLAPEQITVLHDFGVALFAEVPRIEEQWPSIPADAHRCVLILSMRTLPDVPSSTLQKMLRRKTDLLHERGGRLMIAGIGPQFRRGLTRAGIVETIGAQNLYPAGGEVFDALDTAYADAQRWLRETHAP